MFRKSHSVLGLLVSVAAAAAAHAQEPPRPAPAPKDTSVPGESLRTTFLPTADLRIFTNGNVNVVGQEESAVGMSVGLVLPLNWVRQRSSWTATYSTGAQLYGEEHSSAEDIPHNFSTSFSHIPSRRWEFGFNLSGTKSEQQSFNEARADQVTTLVPRTDVTRVNGGAHMSFTLGERSYFDMGISGGLNSYDDIAAGELATDLNGNGILDPAEDTNGNGVLDPAEDLNGNGILDPGEDTNGNSTLDPSEDLNGNGLLDPGESSRSVAFVDAVYAGADLSWGMTISPRTTVGVGYAYNQIRYEDLTGPIPDDLLAPLDTQVHNLYFNGTRRFSTYTTGSLQLGVMSAQQDASEDRIEPSFSASMNRQVTEQSSFTFGLQQSAGAGSGRGVATLDRGLYGSWNWSRPRMNASVALGYWDRATLISPFASGGGSSTYQMSESFGWTPGSRFSYGVFHAFRDQQADDPTLEAKGYHSGGLFVRWNIRGRSARVG